MNNPCAADDGTYVVVPWLVLVVDDGGAEAPGGVDAGAGDGDGGQVDHEHGEPDGKRSKHLNSITDSAARYIYDEYNMMVKHTEDCLYCPESPETRQLMA